MKKQKTQFYKIKLLAGIALFIIMTSCNGQGNNGDKQNTTIENEKIQFPNFIFGLALKVVRISILATH